MNRKSIFTWVTGLSSIIAAGLHAYLSWEYFQVKYALGGGDNRLCQLSERFDCAAVAASPYAAVLDIPVAMFGLWTNILLVGLLVIFIVQQKFNNESGPIVRFGLLLTGVAIAVGTLVMGFISVSFLKTYCTFCIATYALSLLTLWGLYEVLKQDPDFKLEIPAWHPSLIALALFIPALSWFGNAVMMDQIGGSKLNVIIQESLIEWRANPSYEFDTSAGVAMGASTENAKNIVIEFADLFCPHCKFASKPLKAFTRSRPNTRLIIKMFPLDGTCNPAINMTGDGLRCKWAYAVTCANDNGQGGAAMDWVFDRQSTLLSQNFLEASKQMALDLNLDAASLSACIESDETKQKVVFTATEGQTAQIRGTPSIFLNSRLLPRGQLLPILEAATQN